MDVTDDQVHENQEGAFFNPYYKGVCYARVRASQTLLTKGL